MPLNSVETGAPQVVIAGAPMLIWPGADLESVVVEDNLHLPDVARITLRQKEGETFTFGPARPGVPLQILMSSAGLAEATYSPIFVGEIVSLEADYNAAGGSRLVIMGYDKSHRMHTGCRTESYPFMPDNVIATQIATRNGLIPGEIHPTPPRIEEVSQLNMSDWEFLKARAREVGYECGVSTGMLYFRKPKYMPPVPSPVVNYEPPVSTNLVFGSNLQEFRPRVTGSGQVLNVKARGWDFLTKTPTIGVMPPVAAMTSPGITTTSATAAALFSPQDHVVAYGTLTTIPDAMAAAQGMANHINAALAEAEGLATGNTAVSAGSFVVISGVETTFQGSWRVTSAQHIYEDGMYHTRFTVSGLQERSLAGLMSGGTTNSPGRFGPPIYGVVVAIVVDLLDPLMLGRVKVKFPWLDDSYKTDWCRITCMGAGAGSKGTIFYPEVDDEVLVAFEHGDARRPYVIGQLYNGRDLRHKPPMIVTPDGKAGVRGFRSREGHQITFFDKDTTLRNGVSMATGGPKRKLKIALKDGPNPIPEIAIGSDGTITIKAMQDITIESDMNINMKAKMNINIEAMGQLNLKGTAAANLESSGITVVKGSMVNIN